MWTQGFQRYLRVNRLAHTAHENLALGLSELVRWCLRGVDGAGGHTVFSVSGQILNSRKGLFTRLAVERAFHLATGGQAWPFGMHVGL
jgi:hypothetical protein